jgi:hypothetical protein
MENFIFFKEIDYTPTENQQNFLNFVGSNDFPLFYNKTYLPKHMMYAHTLMARKGNFLPEEGIVNSSYFGIAKSILLDICNKNNIQVDTILRSAINNTIHYPDDGCGIHVDHEFPHFNFIYHINDTDAPTVVFDKKNNELFRSTPKMNRATIFSGLPHIQKWCKPYEQRIVLVFTFLGKIGGATL